QPYSANDLNWRDKGSRSTIEMSNPNTRPQIANHVDNMDEYDIIILGYPIWWGIAPRIIDTFLESYDFSGKKIIPFCTSGGSGVGRSDIELHKNVSQNVKWEKGVRIVHLEATSIQNWLKGIL
ncbi:MAG: flavodoxin, partial [Allobaculum sp.]|nr:flavodoxin [Allobaculum sp.]